MTNDINTEDHPALWPVWDVAQRLMAAQPLPLVETGGDRWVLSVCAEHLRDGEGVLVRGDGVLPCADEGHTTDDCVVCEKYDKEFKGRTVRSGRVYLTGIDFVYPDGREGMISAPVDVKNAAYVCSNPECVRVWPEDMIPVCDVTFTTSVDGADRIVTEAAQLAADLAAEAAADEAEVA